MKIQSSVKMRFHTFGENVPCACNSVTFIVTYEGSKPSPDHGNQINKRMNVHTQV